MCSARLKLHNENIPASIVEEHEAVSKHKNSMTMNSKNVRKVKVEPIIRSSHKNTAQLMTSNEKNRQFQNACEVMPKWIKCHQHIDQEHNT